MQIMASDGDTLWKYHPRRHYLQTIKRLKQ